MTTSSSSLELNTVLAALRYFQANYSEAVPLFDGELGELLSCDAIDNLCERINSDAVENVLSNLTDETYSTSPVPTDKEVVEREDALQQMLDELAKTPGKLMVEGMLAFIRNFADYTGRKTIARITLSALEHLVENPEEVNDSFAEALVDYALRDRKLVTNEELKLRLAGALHREGLLASADGSEDTPEFVYPSITWLIDCVCNDGLRKETYRDNAISWCATLMRATSIMIEELTEISQLFFIEDFLGATTWSRGDRLTVEEVNEFPEIRAESWAYGAAMELGIKVTHREERPDCGTYCPVSNW